MATPTMVFQMVLGLAGAGLNLVFWFFVVKRWQERFRLYCERRFDVRITLGSRGHWNVDGKGSWVRRSAIEWLQLAYFMGAFAVWAVAILLLILAIELLEKLG